MDIKLNLTYNASIMLNVFKDLLCSKLCWHNSPGPSYCGHVINTPQDVISFVNLLPRLPSNLDVLIV